MGSPERRDGGVMISIASKKAEDNDETLSPVVDSILLKGINFDERPDIKDGIKKGKNYTIKGASVVGVPISGAGTYDSSNNNRALTLFIDSFESIEGISSTQQTTENNVRPETTNNENNSGRQSILRERDIDKKREKQNKYNQQYFYENHPDLVEYKETLTKLGNNYSLRTDKESHRQIGEKRNVLGKFQTLYEDMTDERVSEVKNSNENELNKRRELTKLMKEVMSDLDKNSTFPEMPYGPADELKSLREETVQAIDNALNQEPKVKGSDLYEDNIAWRQLIFSAKDASEINSIKGKVLDDIKSKRELKISAADLGKTLQGVAENGNNDDLKEAIKTAEKENGRESYSENKPKVEELKEKLLNNSIEDYRKMVNETIDDILKKTETSKDELGAEIQQKIQKFNTQSDKGELKALEEEIILKVNEEG